MRSHDPIFGHTSQCGRSGHGAARLLAAAALLALAAGCATANAATPTRAPAATASQPPPSPATAMPPGMVMAPSSQQPGTAQTNAPSPTALMVCGPEIGGDVKAALGLPTAPKTTTIWSERLFTCTYHLPAGSLVLSVKESPDTASANTYLQALRRRWGTAHALTGALGLGDPGYETPDGRVAILKDDKTLQVDATGLPTASGPNRLSRSDLAYEIATDVIGCWNGQ